MRKIALQIGSPRFNEDESMGHPQVWWRWDSADLDLLTHDVTNELENQAPG